MFRTIEEEYRESGTRRHVSDAADRANWTDALSCFQQLVGFVWKFHKNWRKGSGEALERGISGLRLEVDEGRVGLQGADREVAAGMALAGGRGRMRGEAKLATAAATGRAAERERG